MSSDKARGDAFEAADFGIVGTDDNALAKAAARWFRRGGRRNGEPAIEDEVADAAERRIADTLATFRTERPHAPGEMVDDILAYVFEVVEDAAEARRSRVKLFVAAGGVAALAGGAVIGVVALERRTKFFSRTVPGLVSAGKASA